MKSFGLWFKKKSEETENSDLEIDVHINLWDLHKNKKRKILEFAQKITENENEYIDIGLKIKKIENVQEICIMLPFCIRDKKQVTDLSEKINNIRTANLIFNRDCTVSSETAGGVSESFIKYDNKKFLLYNFETNENMKVEQKEETEITLIKIDLPEIENDVDGVYVRFRVNSSEIGKMIFCDIKKKNWFLESGFTKTKIIDLKINKKRNIDDKIIKDMKNDSYKFAELNKIHFLVIEQANNVIEDFGKDQCDCRYLEDEWKEYMRNEDENKNLLAYHWRKTERDYDYGKTIKVTEASTSKRIILVYMLIVILLSMVAGAIYDLLKLIIFI